LRTYKKNELQKITKKYNLVLGAIKNEKYKEYTKLELYNNIENFLNK
jgi:hypothetical protein